MSKIIVEGLNLLKILSSHTKHEAHFGIWKIEFYVHTYVLKNVAKSNQWPKLLASYVAIYSLMATNNDFLTQWVQPCSANISHLINVFVLKHAYIDHICN